MRKSNRRLVIYIFFLISILSIKYLDTKIEPNLDNTFNIPVEHILKVYYLVPAFWFLCGMIVRSFHVGNFLQGKINNVLSFASILFILAYLFFSILMLACYIHNNYLINLIRNFAANSIFFIIPGYLSTFVHN